MPSEELCADRVGQKMLDFHPLDDVIGLFCSVPQLNYQLWWQPSNYTDTDRVSSQ